MAKDRYLEPYRQWAKHHGTGFEVTLWANPAAQSLRFEVFCQMCALANKRILDAGCSRGDFAAYLVENNLQFSQYIGIDGLNDVITYAQQRDLPRCGFICGDFLRNPQLFGDNHPQVICISGTLNTMSDQQVIRVLDAAWNATSESLLFNFLSNLAGPAAPTQTKPARRLHTLRLLKWAATKTGRVTYRQDYFNAGHDATILMTKHGPK